MSQGRYSPTGALMGLVEGVVVLSYQLIVGLLQLAALLWAAAWRLFSGDRPTE